MIERNLALWIAQSESWQTFVDFKLPQESIANYAFLSRFDAFYISLFGEMYEALDDLENRKNDLLPIAKGLEIFSLKGKKEAFQGISQARNMTYAASLYYLADYGTSAYLLAKLYKISEYDSPISKFVSSFLQRNLSNEDTYSNLLTQYFNSGEIELLNELIQVIQKQKEHALSHDHAEYSFYFLALKIVQKFKESNIWKQLLLYGAKEHWENYVQNSISKKFPVWDFFPSQKIALEAGVLSEGQSIALQTPTSSGKTAICELVIYNEFQKNPECKILYLAPFRALASELKESFGKNLGRLGIKSKTIYGGNIPTFTERTIIGNVNLLIATPEKLMAIENLFPDLLKEFSLIICDEGHLLDSGNRGLNYELLLSRLRSNPVTPRRFLFISAIIPNIGKIVQWLGGTMENIAQSLYRPTELEFAFLREMELVRNSFYLDVNPYKPAPQNYKLNKFLEANDFRYENITPTGKRTRRTYSFNSVKVKAVACALKALPSGSVALFSPTKGGRTGVNALAEELIDQLNIPLNLPQPSHFIKNPEILRDLRNYFDKIFGNQYILSKLISHGALLHHGDLPQYVREVIEDAIRKEEIRLIICTNTLAEGVNLPIRTIVIYSTKRYDPSLKRPVPIPIRDLKNLSGRAGRAGKETKGLIIVANESDFDTIENLARNDAVEDISGFLYSVIESITETIISNRLTLSNEILESQSERFKQLIDTIDLSIVNLLSEEIVVENLMETIQRLIDQTFAKTQCNEPQSKTLNDLLTLRGERIKSFIEANEFTHLKRSNSSIRQYYEIKTIMDIENPIWSSDQTATDDKWLEFIIDEKLLKLTQVSHEITEFNVDNDSKIDAAELRKAIKLWISGKWFEEIALALGIEIETSIRLINSFINFTIHSTASCLINSVEARLKEREQNISKSIVNWPNYLIYGVSNTLHLSLIELGLNDRIAILELSDALHAIGIGEIESKELRTFLLDTKDDMIAGLQGKLPEISMRKVESLFSYLEISSIF